jgi:ubiquitin carboxyl-terminal hydrolase 9/24
MEPYNVSGLSKLEGEVIDCDYEESIKGTCTKYQLPGIVVHSGQASGGHYYSSILHSLNDGTAKWYKFDDGDVTECKIEEKGEMKSQCFGGDFLVEESSYAQADELPHTETIVECIYVILYMIRRIR